MSDKFLGPILDGQDFLEEALHEDQDSVGNGNVLPVSPVLSSGRRLMKTPQTVSTAEEDEIFDQPKEYVEETYLALVKGLKVSRNRTIADRDENVVGKVEEGDPVALDGYEIGDDGKILNVYGNVIEQAGIAEDREKVEEETRAQEEKDDQEEDEAQAKEVEDLHEEAEWEVERKVELKPNLDIQETQ